MNTHVEFHIFKMYCCVFKVCTVTMYTNEYVVHKCQCGVQHGINCSKIKKIVTQHLTESNLRVSTLASKSTEFSMWLFSLLLSPEVENVESLIFENCICPLLASLGLSPRNPNFLYCNIWCFIFIVKFDISCL